MNEHELALQVWEGEGGSVVPAADRREELAASLSEGVGPVPHSDGSTILLIPRTQNRQA